MSVPCSAGALGADDQSRLLHRYLPSRPFLCHLRAWHRQVTAGAVLGCPSCGLRGRAPTCAARTWPRRPGPAPQLAQTSAHRAPGPPDSLPSRDPSRL